MLWLLAQQQQHSAPARRLAHSQAATILMQAGVSGMGYLKERWTEDEVLNLPQGEHNYFERKAGRLFTERVNLNPKLAKALSALANSGGGYLILGQADDGTIDGIPEKEGRTPIREWIEQRVPTLVAYPLESFRVHAVERHPTATQVPSGKELVVIDVGESRLAPHQASFPSDNPQYYYRQGGKSMPAPHHFLEALRNRLTGYALTACDRQSATS
jgi:predicted HTH transcriptional regulator